MATSALEQPATLEIPADYVDDFRHAIVLEIQSDVAWHKQKDDELSERLETPYAGDPDTTRVDRAGALKTLRQDALILGQLPDQDIACRISDEVGNLRALLDQVGRLWAARLADQFAYCPANIELLPPLLERLQWVVEQAKTIEVD